MFDFAKQKRHFDAYADHLKVPLFSLTGDRPGPRLVVLGGDEIVRGLVDRLWNLPDLMHIRGALIVRADDQDAAFDRPDAVFNVSAKNEIAAFYQVLGRMTRLGMISGRGVPVRWVA